MKKKKQEVEFSAYERRVFELPQLERMYGPEALALRKIIDAMPWMPQLADFKFDQNIGRSLIAQESLKIQGERMVAEAIRQYAEKKK